MKHGAIKKVILGLSLLLAFGIPCLCAQEADVVVLMDTSGTLLPWFDQINSRVLPDITEKFIRKGDTFHLISFNSRVNLELVQPIENEADISRVVSRFMLLYPLGKNSDFLSGLKYTWQYISSLNQQRQKIIIVISDGIFNPPESSPYASYTLQQVQDEVSQSARRIRGAGWHVYYIKLPYPEDVAILSLDGNFVTERRSPQDSGATQDTGDGYAGTDSVASVSGGRADAAAGTGAAAAQGGPGTDTRDATDSSAAATQDGTSSSRGAAAGGSATEADADGTESSVTRLADGTPVTSETPVSQTPDNSYYDISREFTGELEIPPTVLTENQETPLEFADSVFHLPRITFPEDLGKRARYFTLRIGVENPADYEVNMQLTAVDAGQYGNILEESVFLNLGAGRSGTLRAPLTLPETVGSGGEGTRLEIPVALRFSDNLRVDPQTGVIRMELVGMTAEAFFRTHGFVILTVVLILLVLIALIALIVFISSRTGKPVAEISRAAGSQRRDTRPAAAYSSSGGARSAGRTASAASAGGAAASAAGSARDRDSLYAYAAENEARSARAAETSTAAETRERKREESAYGVAYASSPFAASSARQSGNVDGDRRHVLSAFATASDSSSKHGGRASSGTGTGSSDLFERQIQANAADNNAKYSILGSKSDGISVRRDISFDPTYSRPASRRALVADSDGRVMLNLFVENQNTNIGKRNVHQIKSGARLSVGGGASQFLIFLVKFPANIAEVRYNGSTCSLSILKPEYFPYEKSSVINDCIDRPITAVSDKGYPVTFMIRQFEDPVVTLNRFLNSINEP